jgi:hypothetical protein
MKELFNKFKTEIISVLVISVVAILVPIILPEKLKIAASSFISFFFTSIRNDLLFLFLYISIIFITFIILSGKKLYKIKILFCVAITLTYTILTTNKGISNLFSDLNKGGINLNFMGCYAIREDQLYSDENAKYLEYLTVKQFNRLGSEHTAFRTNEIRFNYKPIPKFLTVFWGAENLFLKLKNISVKSKSINISLIILKDVNSQKLSFILFYDELLFSGDELFNIIGEEFSSFSNDNSFGNENLITYTTSILVSYVGQITSGINLNNNAYNLLYSDINDSKRIISNTFEQMNNSGSETTKKKIKIIQNFLLCSCLRWEALAFAQQGEVVRSAEIYFSTLRINPYWPLSDYNTFKNQALNEYYLDIDSIISHLRNDSVRLFNHDLITVLKEKTLSNFTYISLEKLIIHYRDNKLLIKAFSEELKQLTQSDENNPVFWFIKGELTKFVPKGANRHNNLYIDRIDESITYFRKALAIDKSFGLAQSKLTGLVLIKWVVKYTNNEEKNLEPFLNKMFKDKTLDSEIKKLRTLLYGLGIK